MFAAHAAFMTGTPAIIRSTSLSLLHFDNNVTDIGASASTWTNNSGTFSTTSKFGTHSLNLSGSHSLYSNQSFSMPSPFTAECWVKTSNLSQIGNIFGMQTNGSGYAPFLAYQVYGSVQFNIANASLNGWDRVISGGSLSTSSFVHIAVSGNGTTVRAFVDGTEVVGVATTHPAWSTSVPLHIGNDSSGSYPITGLVDEFRFDSVCYYTGNFTPPTAAFS